jgi:hypothetical protein
MKIVFNVRSGDGVVNVSPASVKAVDEMPPVIAADYWLDVLCNAIEQYDRARIRCGWRPMHECEDDA